MPWSQYNDTVLKYGWFISRQSSRMMALSSFLLPFLGIVGESLPGLSLFVWEFKGQKSCYAFAFNSHDICLISLDSWCDGFSHFVHEKAVAAGLVALRPDGEESGPASRRQSPAPPATARFPPAAARREGAVAEEPGPGAAPALRPRQGRRFGMEMLSNENIKSAFS